MQNCFALEHLLTVAKAEVAAASTNVTDAAVVDMKGYNAVAFVAILGADTAATAKVTLKAAVSDASSMAGAVTLDKTAEYTAQSETDADDKLLVLDVIEPGKRYVRPLIDRETANADILALLAIRYNGMGVPSEMGDVLARSVATV